MSLFVVGTKKSIWAFDSVRGEIGQTTWVWFGLNHICHLMVGRDRCSGRTSGCLKLGLVPSSQTHNHRVWECEGTLCTGGGHEKEDLRAVYSLDLIIISAPESFWAKADQSLRQFSQSPILHCLEARICICEQPASKLPPVSMYENGWVDYFCTASPIFWPPACPKTVPHPTISLPWGFF